MFPGQGSQKKGMGSGIFELFPDLTRQANEILGYSIQDLCLHDAREELGLTQFTQPALYVVNALSYFKATRIEGKTPAFAIGHSLGEYNALLAAGVFDFPTGLRLVQRRGALMAQAQGGGMAAVVGLDNEKVKSVLFDHGLASVDLANLNAPTQIVISGPRSDIERAQAVFEAAGAAMFVPLKVSGAFHSRYMEPFRIPFLEFIKGFTFASPAIPVISNVEASPYTANRVPDLLANQLTHSVRWVDSVRSLKQLGTEEFLEIGPGKVLTGLLRKIQT